jgi:hypothetical protein
MNKWFLCTPTVLCIISTLHMSILHLSSLVNQYWYDLKSKFTCISLIFFLMSFYFPRISSRVLCYTNPHVSGYSSFSYLACLLRPWPYCRMLLRHITGCLSTRIYLILFSSLDQIQVKMVTWGLCQFHPLYQGYLLSTWPWLFVMFLQHKVTLLL